MKALFVDLSSRKMEEEEIGELLPRYLGGVGIGARLAFDLIPPGCDPLGEENVLIFCPGSLVGTNIPTASRTEITAKSPLTGLIGTSNSGLYFGAFLRYAGFDCLVIKGAASEPVYLLIEDGE
ncbi:MAG: aldehyde ferredoxin oxidoreductase, partial [Deltaproteobacteria bacterium]